MTMPPELLAVREVFPNSWVERWAKGPAAERRVRQLRKVLARAITTRTLHDTRRLWTAPGADRVTVEVTEITYIAKAADIPAPLAQKEAA